MRRWDFIRLFFGVSIIALASMSTVAVLSSSRTAQIFTGGLLVGGCLGVLAEAFTNAVTDRVNAE